MWILFKGENLRALRFKGTQLHVILSHVHQLFVIKLVISKLIISMIDILHISCEITLRWCSVHTGSGNGLVPSGNKPLPEPVFTPIYVTI